MASGHTPNLLGSLMWPGRCEKQDIMAMRLVLCSSTVLAVIVNAHVRIVNKSCIMPGFQAYYDSDAKSSHGTKLMVQSTKPKLIINRESHLFYSEPVYQSRQMPQA